MRLFCKSLRGIYKQSEQWRRVEFAYTGVLTHSCLLETKGDPCPGNLALNKSEYPRTESRSQCRSAKVGAGRVGGATVFHHRVHRHGRRDRDEPRWLAQRHGRRRRRSELDGRRAGKLWRHTSKLRRRQLWAD